MLDLVLQHKFVHVALSPVAQSDRPITSEDVTVPDLCLTCRYNGSKVPAGLRDGDVSSSGDPGSKPDK